MKAPSEFDTAQRPPGAEPFRLIETMRAEEERVAHRERHLARLQRSARRFGFDFLEDGARAEVQKAVARLGEEQSPSKVRLTLGADGDMKTEATPLEERGGRGPLRLVGAEARAHSADPFFRHKTTWRRVYRRAYEAAQEGGFDDALLLNEQGHVTEATRANLFWETGGARYTPPVRCGLLPGVGRAAMLAEEDAEERVATPADLREADALWLVSALRGRRRAVWDE